MLTQWYVRGLTSLKWLGVNEFDSSPLSSEVKDNLRTRFLISERASCPQSFTAALHLESSMLLSFFLFVSFRMLFCHQRRWKSQYNWKPEAMFGTCRTSTKILKPEKPVKLTEFSKPIYQICIIWSMK